MSKKNKLMVKPFKVAILFATAFIFSKCVPPTGDVSTDIHVGYSDPKIREILEFQDKGNIDSLLAYLKNPNPGLRYAAIKGLSSIKDVNDLNPITELLDDPIEEIRAMAAYALGQIGSDKAETALIAAFKVQDTISVNNEVNKNILEALGRCGSGVTLKNIASVSTYRTSDNHLILGQMRALYRFGQRNMFDDAARDVAVKYATSDLYAKETQLLAANYLSRFKELDLEKSLPMITDKMVTATNPFIRMCMVNAAGRTPSFDLTQRLMSAYDSEKDYRVKANIIRALGNGDIDTIRTQLFKIIQDPSNIHLATLAAEVLGKKGIKERLFDYKAVITPDLDWRVKVKMYQSIMKITPIFFTKYKAELANEIVNAYNSSSNSYERAGYITALGQDPYQYITLGGLKAKAASPIEKTALAEALGGIMTHPEFFKAYGSKYGEVKQYIINYLIQGSKEGDPGVVAVAGSILKNPEIAAKEYIGADTSWFEVIRSKLKLPRDIEAYNEILEARQVIAGQPFNKYKNSYNHPINVNTLIENGDTVKVVMKTTKGNIIMQLISRKAPGSVANFIELCKKDFYDNKVFHRVVPNFVIQAGCPRGDGYGAEDYTIRSEFIDTYYDNEGYVGMASAGWHTEGTQFFITHSPAPHLDGNYTIFGKVIEGMDVVHNILVGDKILDAIILKQ
jgi:cyclophilin family peptidyl-prolyl cis-trans isomerase/HEAT repeat protein